MVYAEASRHQRAAKSQKPKAKSQHPSLRHHNHRKPQHTLTPSHPRPPLLQRQPQFPHPNPPKLLRTSGQIPPRPLHQRTSPHHIPRRLMMQRHRRLNQPLQKSLLRPVRLSPNVLPNLMRIIKLPRIKQPNPPPIPLRAPQRHGSILRSERTNERMWRGRPRPRRLWTLGRTKSVNLRISQIPSCAFLHSSAINNSPRAEVWQPVVVCLNLSCPPGI